MDFDTYQKAYFVDPSPLPRYRYKGTFGTTLFYEDFEAAVDFYEQVLGPPGYVEGVGTRGWPIGNGWFTLLQGKHGNPQNIEITFEFETVEDAKAFQSACIAAGASGSAPSDQLMYKPVRIYPVVDPFGVDIMIFSALE